MMLIAWTTKALSLLLLCGFHHAYAVNISWDQTQLIKQATYHDTEVSATWTLTNTGEQTVSIAAMKIGCACASITANQQIIAPGNTSRITAVFHIGDRVGFHRQQASLILVDGVWSPPPTAETEDNTATETPLPDGAFTQTLSFSVNIEQPMKLSRRVLFWRKESIATSKKLLLHIDDPDEFSVTGSEGFPDTIIVTIQAMDDPHTFSVHVTPQNTADKLTAKGFIITTHPDKRYARLPLTVLIK